MAKKNLVKMAKGFDRNIVTSKTEKSVEDKVSEKTLTHDEERDLKAKQKVEELLHDVSLTPEKNNDLLDVDEPKGVEWLTEQVDALTAENELLKNDLAAAKDDYAKLFSENQNLKTARSAITNNVDSETKAIVIRVFNELQSEYMRNPGVRFDGIPNFTIHPVSFMNRLILFFPFLAKEKRF